MDYNVNNNLIVSMKELLIAPADMVLSAINLVLGKQPETKVSIKPMEGIGQAYTSVLKETEEIINEANRINGTK
ncbi:hypothetical protein ACX2QB_08155 [Weissella viridescens]